MSENHDSGHQCPNADRLLEQHKALLGMSWFSVNRSIEFAELAG